MIIEKENVHTIDVPPQTESQKIDHGHRNETKDKHISHNTTLKTKAGIIQTLIKLG